MLIVKTLKNTKSILSKNLINVLLLCPHSSEVPPVNTFYQIVSDIFFAYLYAYLCKLQEIVKEREASCAAVHEVTKSQIQLSD